MALAALGEPEEACGLGRQALTSGRVVDSVLSRASELGALMTRRYPALAEGRELAEQIQTLKAGRPDHATGGPVNEASGAPDARTMSIYQKYLWLIAAGRKTVEVRVGYRSMRRITAGDRIRFVSGDEECLTRVTRVTEYPSFETMLDHEDARSIGADELETREELLAAIRRIYPPEKEALGVLAIAIEVVEG